VPRHDTRHNTCFLQSRLQNAPAPRADAVQDKTLSYSKFTRPAGQLLSFSHRRLRAKSRRLLGLVSPDFPPLTSKVSCPRRHHCFFESLLRRFARTLRGILDQSDGALLLCVPSAAVRVPWRAPVAVLPRVGARPGSELLTHLAVLISVAHPLLNVLVEFAPRDAALSAVHLAPGQDPVDGVLLALAVGNEWPGQAPNPLHVIGTGPAS
jgi:hypothetical protein